MKLISFTGAKHCLPIGSESEAGGASDARRPYSDERAGRERHGFLQAATTHHFYLNESGGIIQVEANESTDVTNRDDIRMHLRHIARAFQTGDFDIPMFVHDMVPPGVSEMQQLQKHIRYVFEATPNGGLCGHIINGQARAQCDSQFLAFPD